MATINLFGEHTWLMTSRMIVYALTFQLLHCLCEGYASHVFPPLLHQKQEHNPWYNLFNAVTQFYYRMFDSF